MSAYVMDILCAQHTFDKIKWAWNLTDVPIHVYYDKLWELKYKRNYESICNDLFIPLYHILTDRLAYYMSEEARVIVGSIRDGYVTKDHTYIRIYGATKAPHILPRYVTDHVILLEIAYQTLVHGLRAALVRKKKISMVESPSFYWSIFTRYF